MQGAWFRVEGAGFRVQGLPHDKRGVVRRLGPREPRERDRRVRREVRGCLEREEMYDV